MLYVTKRYVSRTSYYVGVASSHRRISLVSDACTSIAAAKNPKTIFPGYSGCLDDATTALDIVAYTHPGCECV